MILLTGGAGYIGSHIFVELVNSGHNVIAIDNFSNSSRKVKDRISELTQKETVIYDIDVRDYDKLDELFSRYEIDAVIHLAGKKAVGESVSQPLVYYDNNVNGSLILLEVMAKHNVKKIVFSSSATVYLPDEKNSINEGQALSISSPYGRSKLIVEDIMNDLYDSDPQWCITILRYFNPVGAHQSGRLGESPIGVPNNLFPYILKVATGMLPHVNIFGDDYNTIDGTGVRDYIHVLDLAHGHLKALEKLDNQTGVSIYNLGTGVGYSVLEVISTFEKVIGESIPYEIVVRRKGDVGSCFANPVKAQQNLSWYSKNNLIQMCEDAWRWQVLNPKGYE